MSTETKVPSRERVRELVANAERALAFWREADTTGASAGFAHNIDTWADTAAALRYLEALLDAMPQVRETLEAAKGSIRHDGAKHLHDAREYCVGCKLDNALAILDGLEARDG